MLNIFHENIWNLFEGVTRIDCPCLFFSISFLCVTNFLFFLINFSLYLIHFLSLVSVTKRLTAFLLSWLKEKSFYYLHFFLFLNFWLPVMLLLMLVVGWLLVGAVDAACATVTTTNFICYLSILYFHSCVE